MPHMPRRQFTQASTIVTILKGRPRCGRGWFVCAGVCVLGGVVANVVLASGAAARASRPRSATYDLRLDLRSVHFDANSSLNGGQGCVTDTRENDNFDVETQYNGLTIPLTGPASSTINLKATHAVVLPAPGASQEFTISGSSTGCLANPSYQCSGNLEIDLSDPPHLLSTGGLADTRLNLHIESGRQYRVAGAEGNSKPFGCASDFDKKIALLPASNSYMPNMLASEGYVRLSALREMKVGLKNAQQADVELLSKDAPPLNCSGGDTICSEHLSWKGTLKFWRTS